MIVIYGTLAVILVIIGFMIFKNMVSFAQHPTTFLLITWFFGLTVINIILAVLIYAYYYYKININPYGGIQGIPGYEGPPGNIGLNIVDYTCKINGTT
jgi:hypothetical protein